jgi:hypothetical protein
MLHKPADEINVPAQAVELGDRNGTLTSSGLREGRGELGPSLQGIRTLPCFDLYELAGDLKPLCRGEPCDSFPLGVEPEARAALAGSRYAAIGNDRTAQNSLPKLLRTITDI